MATQNTVFPGNTIIAKTFTHLGRLASDALANMIGIVNDEVSIGDAGVAARIAEALRLPNSNITVSTSLASANFFYVLQGTTLAIDLPDPATCDGQIIALKNDTGSTVNVITANGGATDIDGAASYTLTSSLDAIFLIANAAFNTYYVVASNLSASALPTNIPQWQSPGAYLFSSFTAAAFIDSLNINSMIPGTVIHSGRLKHATAFSGPGITSVQAALGIAGSLEEIVPYFDIASAPAGSNFAITNIVDSFDNNATTQLVLTIKTTGAFVNALSAGAISPAWLRSIIVT